MSLVAEDCSRIDPPPNEEERGWLHRLSREVRARSLLVSFAGVRDEGEEVVYCERDGSWHCGRYVGTVVFEGRRLTVMPRFGLATLGHWLEVALHLRLTDTAGAPAPHEAFLPRLLARLWGNAIVRAARHGLPGLRMDVEHRGVVARGRLEVRGTIRERVRGRPGLVSVHRERSLDNPITRAIRAAEAELTGSLGALELRTLLPERARDVLAALGGINRERRLPEAAELAAIRYTPITAGYRDLVQLSMTIASHRGLLAEAAPDGRGTGMLVDVAEIWELYVLECLRRAYPNARVRHGTRELVCAGHLLRSERAGEYGRLLPDAVVSTETETFLVDAKYKSLHPTASHPAGAAREDLYQMCAYLSRWSKARLGVLVYPQESGREVPDLVAGAPWFFEDGRELRFVTLSHRVEEAVGGVLGLDRGPRESVALRAT